jgi:hypothetical protein
MTGAACYLYLDISIAILFRRSTIVMQDDMLFILVCSFWKWLLDV